MRPTDALAQLVKQPSDAVRLRTARIDAFTATTATVTLAGGAVSGVPYLASYTPTIGHIVLLLQTTNGLLVIIGRVA